MQATIQEPSRSSAQGRADGFATPYRTDRAAVWSGIAVSVVAVLLLIAPAIWNRFPLLEYDTGGYLARWFEGYLVPSRSPTYGFFLAAGWPFDFWPIVVLQAAAAVWVIWLVFRVHGLTARPFVCLAIFIALSLATTLPWIASVLLTDIFAAPAVLAIYLFVRHAARLGRYERMGLMCLAGYAVSTHSATFAMIAALAAAMLVLSLIDYQLVPRAAVGRSIGVVALGVAMLFAANYTLAKRITWTPGGYGIVFGRMLEDGIVARYLKDHCPDQRLRLCNHRDELALTADQFLWGRSVFDRLGRFEGLGNEMRTIVLESLAEYPWLQLKAALVAMARQLVHVRSGEGVLTTIWHTYGMMETFTPSVVPALRAARQQHDELSFETINRLHVPVGLATMALLPLLLIVAVRRRNTDAAVLVAIVLLAILANAAVCGMLANPHDRYGARIVWLAPLVLMMWPWLGKSAGATGTA